MRYRKLDVDGDYTFGGGQTDFYRDVPEAPAQAVKTRLHLERGTWFLDKNEGMPWQPEVLGNRTASTRDIAVMSHTLNTQGVREILEYNSNLNRDTRGFVVDLTIDTIYGKAQLVEPI